VEYVAHVYRWFFGRPILSTVIPSVCLFAVLYLRTYLPRRGQTFAFDASGIRGDFEKHAERYQRFAGLILTLCTASVAFLINFLVNLSPDVKNRSVYSLKLESASRRTITFLCLSGACGIFFLFLENLFYENYVHSKYTTYPKNSRETYTGSRFAVILSLAGTGLILFFLAFTYLAMKLFE